MAQVTVERSAPVEVRLSGRTLHAIALRYGERARDRAEMFEAGAFQPIGPVALNLQHDAERVIASTADGTLRLDDTAEALRVAADLRDGSAELALVRRRALRGLSVEFRCLSERRENGLRIVSRAELPAIGLVDSGSYRTRVELRKFEDAWLRASIPFARTLQCECQGPHCDSVEFDPDAFDVVLDDPDAEVLAVAGGGFNRVLGSRRRGTLLLRKTRTGLDVGLTAGARATPAAQEVIQSASAAPFYVRPILDEAASESIDQGSTRRFTTAAVRTLLVKPTTNSAGWTPAAIEGVEGRAWVDDVEARRRLWL